MINLSIDAADMEGRFDPRINEIESVIEFVLEVIMDKGDLLPEHDEPETETCFSSIYHIIPSMPYRLDSPSFAIVTRPIGYVLLNYSDPFLTFQSPPPKSGTQSLFF